MRALGRRLRAVGAFSLTIAALTSGVAGGAERIVGGSSIQVQSAPWAVFVDDQDSTEYYDCTGSILDSLHVLTAAHCVYGTSGTLASPTQLSVRAGISNFSSPLASDAEQDRGVSSFTVHPGYVFSTTPGPDDVAVLALSSPLDLSGPAVQAVALPTAGAAYPTGTSVVDAGFGQETSASDPNGQLNSLTGTVDPQGSCGAGDGVDDDAVRFCASSPSAATCEGDSGSGLVTAGATPTLIGVLSAGPPGCAPGSHTIYTYVAAPEILTFVQGDQQPPTAPRATSSTALNLTWDAPLAVGTTVRCSTTDWEGEPTSYAYAFVDATTGTVLEEGPSGTFVAPSADVGDRIECTAFATNAGGTATVTTTASPAIAAARSAPPPTTTTGSTSGTSSRGASTSAAASNALAIEATANAIPLPSLTGPGRTDVPQWNAYLRLALLGNQNPLGPRYQSTYVRCWSAASSPRAASAAPSSDLFAATGSALGFDEPGASWIDVPASTCLNAAKAARGELDPTTIVALGSVLHETFNRQGVRRQSSATCLGAVGVWQAVNRHVGALAADHALGLLLAWYVMHLSGAESSTLRSCVSRIHVDWNG